MEYNAVIREYRGKSLDVLAHVLVKDLKEIPVDWKIHYQSKPVDRETTKIADLCCTSTNPLQIYKPIENSFLISVRTLDGQQMDLVVSKTDKVKLLKLKIFQCNQFYIPKSQKIYLYKNGRKHCLANWETLQNYGISTGCVLYVKYSYRQNSYIKSVAKYKEFQPVDVQNLYPGTGIAFPQPEKQQPLWSKYSAGVNLCGVCPNEKCISREHGGKGIVIINILQYGDLQFNFADKTEKLLNCPACLPNKSTHEWDLVFLEAV